MTALYWIKNNKEWKISVQNRVDIINKVVKLDNWHYVSSSDSPAHVPSRECLPSSIINNNLWWFGPKFLFRNKESWPEDKFVSDVTKELRRAPKSNVPVNVEFIDHPKQKISGIINISKYSNLMKVLKISFYVLKFVNIIYWKTFKKSLIKVDNIIYDSHFDQYEKLLNLYTDNRGLTRSCSRLTDSRKIRFWSITSSFIT